MHTQNANKERITSILRDTTSNQSPSMHKYRVYHGVSVRRIRSTTARQNSAKLARSDQNAEAPRFPHRGSSSSNYRAFSQSLVL